MVVDSMPTTLAAQSLSRFWAASGSAAELFGYSAAVQ